MKNRRGFLQLLGLAPAAALAPQLLAKPPIGKGIALTTMAHPTGIPFADPPDPAGVPTRYLGLAQLKNEGDPCSFDPEPDEIERFAKEAFGRKELYEWPDAPEYWEEDEA